MPSDIDDELATPRGLVLPSRALSWRFSRSSGPGGQHVNTSDSRVELLCDLQELSGPPAMVARVQAVLGREIRVIAATERSQLQNRLEARRRVITRLDAAAVVPRRRRPTRPSHGAVESRLREKKEASQRKAARRRYGGEE